ncbi:MAG TPA: CdaR family protein, partial [Candidatus Acidoferrales bacterium]|nr:CdaR family protein [Candidatus Acidoferrales bacterium]
PLELRNIPAQLMITSPRVDFIDVRVVGPKTLLGRIDRNRQSIAIDLSGVRPGPSVFRVAAESLNLPRGVRLLRVNPAQLSMKLERVSQKSIPVRIRFVGKPAPDLEVADTKVSPDMVQVSGPASDIDDVHAASTEAIDLSKANAGTLERELPLESAGDYVAFSASRIAVQVRIEEVSVAREFKKVPLVVRNSDGDSSISPSSVRVVVKGPKQAVNDLDVGRLVAYVDATGKRPGEYFMKPAVELPEGAELTSVEPDSVRLTVSGGKRPRHNR